MANKNELTPDLSEQIIQDVRRGVPPKVAAQAAGIDGRVFGEWIEHHPDFAAAVSRAESECADEMLTVIRNAAAGGDAGAARWLRQRGL